MQPAGVKRSARRTDDDRPGANGGGRYHDGLIGRLRSALDRANEDIAQAQTSAGKSDALENRITNSLAVTAIDTHLESLLREKQTLRRKLVGPTHFLAQE